MTVGTTFPYKIHNRYIVIRLAVYDVCVNLIVCTNWVCLAGFLGSCEMLVSEDLVVLVDLERNVF